MVLDLERPAPRLAVLMMQRELARAVGNAPKCPEPERARAVRRIHDYNNEIDYLERRSGRRR